MKRNRNYWLNVHWPPLRTEAANPNYRPNGVLLRAGHEEAGDGLAVGDAVMIYQTLAGKAERDRGPRIRGAGGIVNISEIRTRLRPWHRVWPYEDGSSDLWGLRAETRILEEDGFVPYAQVIGVLGLGGIRHIGRMGSGLRMLTRNEFTELRQIFRQNSG